MASKEISRAGRFEPRWPVILQLLGLVSIATLPARIRLIPHWLSSHVNVCTPVAHGLVSGLVAGHSGGCAWSAGPLWRFAHARNDGTAVAASHHQ